MFSARPGLGYGTVIQCNHDQTAGHGTVEQDFGTGHVYCVVMVRKLPPKKCSFYLDFVHKGGGGPTKTKRFGALFVNQNFWGIL